MGWLLTDDVEDFLARAEGFLAADRARHTIVLSLAATVRAAGNDVFGGGRPLWAWHPGSAGGPAAVAVHTPPYPVAASALAPDQADALVGALLDAGRVMTAVGAEPPSARAFAAAWAARTGGSVERRFDERLHRLAELRDPTPLPPGRARAATEDDLSLLREWFAAFCVEAGVEMMPEAQLRDRLSYGGLLLWTDGEPAALAGHTRVQAGVGRIGPVFTPVGRRRHGYGGAATVAAARAARAAGADEVVLYTDLANPTSNALYARLGFVPVADRLSLRLVPPPVPSTA